MVLSSKIALGLDGCAAGWFAVFGCPGNWHRELVSDRHRLQELLSISSLSFVDIPIGLSDNEAARQCDRWLRKRLGRSFAACVFNPPARSTLAATFYTEACRLNQERTGKKISVQTWNLVPKIRQIDEILTECEFLRDRVRESHPELLFQLLNGDRPLTHKKKTAAGQEERRQLLYNAIAERPNWDDIRASYRKKDVATDDIFDATVLAYFAAKAIANGTRSFPEPGSSDPKGLTMAISWARLG